MAANPKVQLRKLNPQYFEMKVKIQVTREWKLRYRIARWLIWLAAMLLGCGIRFEE